jgi:HEPN domain-containing protein
MKGLQPSEVAHLWLRRARSDLALGKAALQTPGVLAYPVQTRYPGDWEPVRHEEAELALERAALVLAWVDTQLA